MALPAAFGPGPTPTVGMPALDQQRRLPSRHGCGHKCDDLVYRPGEPQQATHLSQHPLPVARARADVLQVDQQYRPAEQASAPASVRPAAGTCRQWQAGGGEFS